MHRIVHKLEVFLHGSGYRILVCRATCIQVMVFLMQWAVRRGATKAEGRRAVNRSELKDSQMSDVWTH